MKLKDRVAIITGATSCLGEAPALLFAKEALRSSEMGADLRASGGDGNRRLGRKAPDPGAGFCLRTSCGA